jgi:flavodoxin
MNIGIIIYSQTGNTYSVGKRIKNELSNRGHNVDVERIILDQEQSGKKGIEFKTVPTLSKYDALIFGAPVEAFSLNRVMKEYLLQITSLENKKVACFVTKALPYNWTGGNRAIRQMKKLCESRNGILSSTGIIVWMNKKREKSINTLVKEICSLF